MIRRFNRFELKYIVAASTRDALVEELRPHVRPDPEGGPSGSYRVTSLYYDTADGQFFRSKIEGIKFRRKLRIRVYGDPGRETNPPSMVEIKQRINRTTQKRRVCLPLEEAYALCAGELERPPPDPRDQQVASEVQFLVRALRLQASCFVSYMRQAFMGGVYEPGLRITFDQLLWSAAPSMGFAGDGPRHVFLPPDHLILEVKANEAVPLWVSHLLARHRVPLRRYSKYCAGLGCLRERARPSKAAAGGSNG